MHMQKSNASYYVCAWHSHANSGSYIYSSQEIPSETSVNVSKKSNTGIIHVCQHACVSLISLNITLSYFLYTT